MNWLLCRVLQAAAVSLCYDGAGLNESAVKIGRELHI